MPHFGGVFLFVHSLRLYKYKHFPEETCMEYLDYIICFFFFLCFVVVCFLCYTTYILETYLSNLPDSEDEDAQK